jgi:hypothetical protein
MPFRRLGIYKGLPAFQRASGAVSYSYLFLSAGDIVDTQVSFLIDLIPSYQYPSHSTCNGIGSSVTPGTCDSTS